MTQSDKRNKSWMKYDNAGHFPIAISTYLRINTKNDRRKNTKCIRRVKNKPPVWQKCLKFATSVWKTESLKGDNNGRQLDHKHTARSAKSNN